MYGFIYMTTNKINNKKYIGQKKFGVQDEITYLGSGNLLRAAIKKYGEHNFERDIIDYAVNREHLNNLEKFYIEKYQAVEDKNFYNIAKGGTGGNNLDLSKKTEEELIEYKRKLSEGIKRAHRLDPTIAKRKSKSLKGRVIHIDSTAKAVLSRRGETPTKESVEATIKEIEDKRKKRERYRKLRQQGIHPKAGQPCSEETKRKISQALKGKYVGELNANYGKKLSEETKEKLRKRALENPMSEELKEKLRKRYSIEYLGKGNPNYGNRWSDEQKKSLSRKQKEGGKYKGKNNPMYGKKGKNAINGVEVIAYDNKGNIVKRFNTVKLALDFLGIKGHAKLNKSIKEGTEYKGYYWKKERRKKNN